MKETKTSQKIPQYNKRGDDGITTKTGVTPFYYTVEIFVKSLSPSFWSSWTILYALPNNLKMIENITTFKNKVKEYLKNRRYLGCLLSPGRLWVG